MPQIPGDVAQIVGLFVECIFYGIYLATFAASLHSIASSRPELPWMSRFKHQRSMLIIILLLFIFSTLNLILGLIHIIAFIRHDLVGVSASDWLNIVKPLCVNLQPMVADCVLIYRCWTVYSKSVRVVILPIILYLGGLACTIVNTQMQGTLQVNKMYPVPKGNHLLSFIYGSWIATISLNIYATFMIVLHIWRVESRSRGGNTLVPLYVTSHPSRLQAVMKAVIESGLLYTVTSITVFITLITNNNSVLITTGVDIQVIGIAFNLLLIRAAQNSEGTVIMPTGNAPSAALNFAHGATSSSDDFTSRDVHTAHVGQRITSKIIVDSGDLQAGNVDSDGAC